MTVTEPSFSPSRIARGGQRTGRRENRIAWALLSPTLVVLAIMTIGPAIYLLVISFQSSTLLSGSVKFVGFMNYKQALTNQSFLSSMGLTIFFVVVVVTLQMLLGLCLAIPLAKQTKSGNLAAALLLLPFATTPAVAAMMFKELLNPNYGWFNHYLSVVGLPSGIEWLSHTGTAWVALIGLDVWQWTPFVALILMAGLQSLPQEPFEAAALDGANAWRTLRHVTLPMLAPFLAIALVLRTIQAFKTFDAFRVLTGGGPGASTEIINLGIFRIALQSFRVGAASAMAILLLILLLMITPWLTRVVGKNADPEGA